MRLKNTFFAVCAASLLVPGLASAGTIADWQAAGIITVGDKDFTFISASANLAATDVTITEVVTGIFTVNIGDGMSNVLGAGVTGLGDLQYSVTITDPTAAFTNVALDSTHIGGDTRVDKVITGGGSPHLVSTNGGIDFKALTGTFVTVDDQIDISSGSALTSIQNSYRQTTAGVPEMDANVFASALTLLFGCVAVMLGRRKVAPVVG
jgi:hypothetical protein